ncbi:two-component system nitrate/nitrite response regulator NarL [Streptomyces umbrinus]|uniref:Two-component system nitrate/nitrite response regulator NarL n=1 Tax=Streptomyces umbrinus TaxID=67370 RepID=A0ABU0SNC1_9ACTN|nr:response regulator transcription factor [Streptomyces umbrinus]MDQ1025052.1 two-component system nitrate/nitrite response regulator NarL [Streptomyces umbrinus]
MNEWGSVRVAVVARGEVARGGLARMLADVAHVEQYAVFEPEDFTAAAPEDAIQLLILSCDVLVLWCANGSGLGENAWSAELAAVARKNGIRVALMLPGAEVKRAASGGGVPCDAVLDQNALTTEGLGDALRRLSRGERLVPESLARVPSLSRGQDTAPPAGSPIGVLTERERQVLELLVDGLSNKQIGRALSLSEHAAKRIVAIVLSKLNCPNRTQAVAVALREGLIGTDEADFPALHT